MSAVAIREFRPQDSEAVSALIRENLLKVNSRDYPEPVIQRMAGLFTSEYIMQASLARTMIVAVEGEKVIGTASLDGDTLYTVFVDMNYHGGGVGRSLIQYLEQTAWNSGVHVLQVPSSLTAEYFYGKMGYRRVRVIESEDFGTDIIMFKELQPITYLEHTPAGDEFIRLVESAGWQGITEKGNERLEAALRQSWLVVSAFKGNRLVGIGRVISDGVVQALICDLIIVPDEQGRGIGSGILKRLLKKCKEQEIPMVQLFAAAQKADFYKKFGFEERPEAAPGMRWVSRDCV
ncbi:GNAT family N-acetyltransferase [Paenibacillus sp. 7124]|uniref:GNAT family N-acetyltransferase n=1 Tax=Paenibacillus apii TaxID=1850370 RepID=A0A6M1PHB4_9BACL|nr:GNAT family N-acetyltransferase [Paenibacillus apii]NGM81695.1 GNAT family N-acetyltransferase [Paenibacillus apii]NJJ41530.1 GNAT family N-acetyltransferase [Paenibacillus apii]